MNYYDRSSQFKYWFPFYYPQLLAASNNCSKELSYYWVNGVGKWDQSCGTCASGCALVLSCLLSNLREHVKANMASAAVLLGFFPTILSILGPSLKESTPLLLDRPVFASLLIWSSPAVNPTTVFEMFEINWDVKTDDRRQLRAQTIAMLLGKLEDIEHKDSRKWLSSFWRWTIGTCQIMIVVAATANTLWVSILLDLQTRVVWHCSMSGQVVLWCCLGVFVRWLCACGFLMEPVTATSLSSDHIPTESASIGAFPRARTPLWTAKTAGMWGAIWNLGKTMLNSTIRRIQAETTPIFYRAEPSVKERTTTLSLYSELSYWAASLLALVHYGYGTLLFSSLMFISVNDAAIVLARYAASIFCCRLVLLFELECMKFRLK